MADREIQGENFGLQRIKCEHCGGSGKCGCFDCFQRKVPQQRTSWGNDIPLINTYKDAISDDPNFKVECQKCNGFGFLLMDKDGCIMVPKLKK